MEWDTDSPAYQKYKRILVRLEPPQNDGRAFVKYLEMSGLNSWYWKDAAFKLSKYHQSYCALCNVLFNGLDYLCDACRN